MIGKGPFSVLLSVACLACLLACALEAQSIRGRVVDADGGAPILNAEIRITREDGFEGSSLSDSLGAFAVRLPGGGEFQVIASSLGYAPSDPVIVEVESWWQLVEIVVSLAKAPIELEGIVVVARGLDLRHRATIAGFRERHAEALDVGPARVVSSDDPEMKTAFDVADVLKWFPVKGGRCTVIYIDGKVSIGWNDVENIVVDGLAGMEFYLNPLDAPLEFRGGGFPCLRGPVFSVLALWREPIGGVR